MSRTLVRPVRSSSSLRLPTEDFSGLEGGPRNLLKRGPPEGPDDNRDAAQAKHHKASSDVCSPDTGTSDVCSPDTITSHACPPDMGTPDACPPAAPPPSARPVQRLRDLYEEIVPVRYSGYKPRNDFELLALGGGDYSFVEDGGLEAFLEKEWSSFVAELNGNPDTLMDEVRRTLDEPAEVVGMKPLPGQADVVIIPIPNSPYSLRMWPGPVSEHQFCMDYVLANDTNKAVNRPTGYNLTFHVPTPLPWLGVGEQALHSVEANFGIPDEDILPGEEKFVVSDGVVCTLEYPEQDAGSVVRIEVPKRGE